MAADYPQVRHYIVIRGSSLLGALLITVTLAAPALADALAIAGPARGQDDEVSEIIVALEADVSKAGRASLRAGAGVSRVRGLRLRDTELVRAPPGELTAALRALSRSPKVRYVEPNSVVHADSVDTYWPLLWGLHNTGQKVGGSAGLAGADIDAPEAWTQSLGAGQTVAIVDSGVTFAHRDVQGQFATNPGESGAGREVNGIDDDGNGLVDDYRGWDFVDGDNLPGDADGHGTHVAGTIAALKDNNVGVVGAAPAAKVMPLRVLDATGSGTNAAVSDAFDLAGDLGIRVVNASLSGGYSRSVREAIAAHPDTLYVAAAGNGGADGIGDNTDLAPVYPCALPEANVVCVGATDSSDQRAAFSNYGPATVDLFAPGVNVVSTWIDEPAQGCTGSCYASLSGTSMAAPHVAATLALMRAANPALTSAALKLQLLAGVDPKVGLATSAVSGGRLNARIAVAAAAALLIGSADTTAPQTTIDSGPSGTISASAPGFGFSASESGSVFECRLDGPDVTTASYSACSSPRSYSGLVDGRYSFLVRATDAAGNTDATPAVREFVVAQPDTTPTPTTSTAETTTTPSTSPVDTTPVTPTDTATTALSAPGAQLAGPTTSPSLPGSAPIRALSFTIPVSNRKLRTGPTGIVAFRLDAPAADGTGTIRLTRVQGSSRRAQQRLSLLGTQRFAFSAARDLIVRVRLSPSGRRLLRRARMIRVRATIRATGRSGVTVTRTVVCSLRLR